ncbi:MAG TPA: mechanosensitive ion channel family protein [Anaerolineae bacterium]|nr:mechanosensitive ion channel family protein [Anaerolineae bacterium]
MTLPVWVTPELERWGVVAIIFVVALLVRSQAGHIANRLMLMMAATPRRQRLRPEREQTLRGLLTSVITMLVLVVAFLASFSLFIDVSTLIWLVGLFSAAFGLGMRPLVSDFFTGLSFLFENPFEVGEKVEMVGLPGGNVEGVIEAVFLRITMVRSPSGELFTIPNGEIRVIRNFSRGLFSLANIHLRITAEHLGKALPLLENLGEEAMVLLPNLLEPWRIISETGNMGQHVELTLAAKARFGKAAQMRPRLLALVQARLLEEGISLAD